MELTEDEIVARLDQISDQTSSRRERAQELSDQLAEEIGGWRNSNPASLDFHTKAAPECGWWAELQTLDPKPKLENWGIKLGEIANHLRSSLNITLHTLMQNEGLRIDRALQYPITSTAKEWRNNALSRQLKGVPERIVRAIYSCQPLITSRKSGRSPADEDLYFLAFLNNTDKHRRDLSARLSQGSATIQTELLGLGGCRFTGNTSYSFDWNTAPGTIVVNADTSPFAIEAIEMVDMKLFVEVTVNSPNGTEESIESTLVRIWNGYKDAALSMSYAWAYEQVPYSSFGGHTDYLPGSSFGQAATNSINGPGTWENDPATRS